MTAIQRFGSALNLKEVGSQCTSSSNDLLPSPTSTTIAETVAAGDSRGAQLAQPLADALAELVKVIGVTSWILYVRFASNFASKG